MSGMTAHAPNAMIARLNTGWKVLWAGSPQECFLSVLGVSEALFGALRARCPKALTKHSMGHFLAGAPVNGGRVHEPRIVWKQNQLQAQKEEILL